jgi:lambda repressor-like predicted transcriptional regulator
MATSRPESQERPYHHGDLPRAIVKAAVEILGETQSLEFSLRELARRAGVSHNLLTSTLPTSASYWQPFPRRDSSS